MVRWKVLVNKTKEITHYIRADSLTLMLNGGVCGVISLFCLLNVPIYFL
jgi:hypothetical protein